MKNISQSRFPIFLVVITLVASIASCSKGEDPEPNTVNYKKVNSLTTETIKTFLTSSGQSQMVDMIFYGVDIYTYKYPMEYQGKTISASGLVCVPIAAGDRFPVLSFQHGTMVAKNEAPSVANTSLMQLSLAMLSGLGYMLIIPDLVGFGSSSDFFHPYLNKESNVNAVVSMLESVKALPDGALSGVSPNDSLFLVGYSQGGWITLATMQHLESQNNSDWNVIGTVCGAGPYNPEQLMNYVLQQESYPKPFFLAYVLLAYINDGTISDNLSIYFNEPYATKVKGLFDGVKTGTSIDAELTTVTHELFDANVFDYTNHSEYAELKLAFEQNRVEAWQNETPLLLLHGEMDTYIPIELSDTLYSRFLQTGSENVIYQSIPLNDHNTAAIPAISIAMNWFQSFRINEPLTLK